MKIGIATHAFSGYYSKAFPEARVIGTPESFEGGYDLLIFTGGEDVSPEHYGQVFRGAVGCNPRRDSIELEILRMALNDSSKPAGTKLLGVCRGLQLINVGLGGTLVQDLRDYGIKPHASIHPIDHTRSNSFSFLSEVNSLHHQAISEFGSKVPGKPRDRLLPTTLARYGDTVELAVWADVIGNVQILATQFHPEFFSDTLYRQFFDRVRAWVSGEDSICSSIKKGVGAPFESLPEGGFTLDTSGNIVFQIAHAGTAVPSIFTSEEAFDEDDEEEEDSFDEDNLDEEEELIL